MRLGENPLFMVTISLALLWIITSLNIRGLGVGKWVQNLGALGTFITATILLAIGFITMQSRGMANAITPTAVMLNLGDWSTLALLSVVCLNFTGLELGSVMGDEIKRPRRTIPRAAIIAGVCTVTLYVVATFSLQAALPVSEIGVIDGILQGVNRAAMDIRLPWILGPIALLMSLNAAGNTSAWLAGSARIPFVIGIDRYLPSVLGKLHPRYSSPYVALIVQGAASSLFIVISAIGATVHEMYLLLLQFTIILQLIPYLYMFAALVRIRSNAGRFLADDRFFRHFWIVHCGGTVGFLMTAVGVVFAFIPSKAVVNVSNFELKIMLGSPSFFLPAIAIFALNTRRIQLGRLVPQSIEVTPE